MQAEKLIRELPKGIIRWYDFQKGCRALLVTDGEEGHEMLSEVLCKAGMEVECVSAARLVKEKENNNTSIKEIATDRATSERIPATYDYIIMIGGLEHSKSPVGLLRSLHSL